MFIATATLARYRGDSSRALRGRRVPESGVELPEARRHQIGNPRNSRHLPAEARELAEMAGSQIENFTHHIYQAVDDRRASFRLSA
jgi:hypothetical protein